MYTRPYLTNAVLWLVLVAVFSFAASFFGLVGGLGFFVGANVAAFAMFFIDKNVAGSAMGRVPEIILYIALWFGILGGFLGMTLMRHKTKKHSFQLIAVLMLLLQMGFAVMLLRRFGWLGAA